MAKRVGVPSGASADRMSAIEYWPYVILHVWWGTIPLIVGLLVVVLTFALRRRNAKAHCNVAQVWAAYFGGVSLALCGIGILLLVGSGCC